MPSEGLPGSLPEHQPVDIDQLHVPGAHVCLIYDNEEERREIVYRFIDAGLKAGERVAYFTEKMDPNEVCTWLTARGVDLPEPGHFDVIAAGDIYCPNGKFVIEDVLEKWREFQRETAAGGFSGARATGETNWSRVVPGGERIVEYCSRLNETLAGSCIGALCQYDAHQFDGATLFDVLRVHPLMLVGSQVVRNPYFMAPQLFLHRNEVASGE